jgi:HEPN domain-containing protein
MRDNNLNEASRWIEQAKSDLVAAEWNAKGKFYDHTCFLSQQATEKALKGFLISRGVRGFVGHSTDYLLFKCSKYDKELKKFSRNCKRLDRHYIPTRYPDGLPGGTPHENYTEEDADESINMAKEVIGAISAKFKDGTSR